MKILIVDDDRTNLSLFSHMLASVDAQVTVFADGLSALEWSRHHAPDLVILDYMMPGMDGLHFLESFRVLSGNEVIPVIMITADVSVRLRHVALQKSANDFLSKPVNKTELIARVKNMLTARKAHTAMTRQIEKLSSLVSERHLDANRIALSSVDLLARAAGHRDPETGEHLSRMANYARIIAENLGLAISEQELIYNAAPMHDIGKMGIPDHILLKPGRLSDDELKIMRTHAAIGADILKGSDQPLLKAGADIALTHHEKWDGTGYPNSLAGDNIPLFGRIVAVADVFDALTSSRPYKQAWSIDQACNFLRDNSGSHFDPACVDAFFLGLKQILHIHENFQDGYLDAQLH